MQKLALYRSKNTRDSQKIFESGLVVLKSGKTTRLGDEGRENRSAYPTRHLPWDCNTGWAFLEQLALASIDIGRLEIADVCLPISSLDALFDVDERLGGSNASSNWERNFQTHNGWTC